MDAFAKAFWTPATIVLVTVTVVVLAIGVAAIGRLLWIVLSIFASELSAKRETCSDEVFGELRRTSFGNIAGVWEGTVTFRHEPTRTTEMQILIDAGIGPPTESQRRLFREIVSRYSAMWPEIVTALAAEHPYWKTVDSVASHVEQPCLSLEPIVAGEPLTWSFEFSFDAENEDGDFGYLVEYHDWKIVGVDLVD